MKVKEYLEQHKVEKITLIKARARKDANTPFYHQEYQTTPIFYKDELERMESLMDYIILMISRHQLIGCQTLAGLTGLIAVT